MLDIADERYRKTRRITLVGGAFDLLLGVLKILVGLAANSQALVADGIHSFSDLGTDFLVILAAKYASREADAEHPYGHARIETAATVLLGLALMAVAVAIGYDAVHRLFNPERLLQPGAWALVIAALSVLIKEAIYHYTMAAAKQLRSNILRANAWHSRSDALSSVVVIIGVGGTMAGLIYLDAVAAVVVAVMIIKVAWDLGWHGARELIDTGLDPTQLAPVRAAILSIDGVDNIQRLRTRRMGHSTLMDVNIMVNPRLSVSEAHHIGAQVEKKLLQEMDDAVDLTVHIDPEDDAGGALSARLPGRQAFLEQLRKRWEDIPSSRHVEQIDLHYLNGKLRVEARVPLSAVTDLDDAKELAANLSRALQGDKRISKIEVLFY